jgi:hypothetical protein
VSKSVLAMPSLYFSVEISRNVWLDSMIPRDLSVVYNGWN